MVRVPTLFSFVQFARGPFSTLDCVYYKSIFTLYVMQM